MKNKEFDYDEYHKLIKLYNIPIFDLFKSHMRPYLSKEPVSLSGMISDYIVYNNYNFSNTNLISEGIIKNIIERLEKDVSPDFIKAIIYSLVFLANNNSKEFLSNYSLEYILIIQDMTNTILMSIFEHCIENKYWRFIKKLSNNLIIPFERVFLSYITSIHKPSIIKYVIEHSFCSVVDIKVAENSGVEFILPLKESLNIFNYNLSTFINTINIKDKEILKYFWNECMLSPEIKNRKYIVISDMRCLKMEDLLESKNGQELNEPPLTIDDLITKELYGVLLDLHYNTRAQEIILRNNIISDINKIKIIRKLNKNKDNDISGEYLKSRINQTLEFLRARFSGLMKSADIFDAIEEL